MPGNRHSEAPQAVPTGLAENPSTENENEAHLTRNQADRRVDESNIVPAIWAAQAGTARLQPTPGSNEKVHWEVAVVFAASQHTGRLEKAR